jgi:hypothetical protein
MSCDIRFLRAEIAALQADITSYADASTELATENTRLRALLVSAREMVRPLSDLANTEKYTRLSLGEDIDHWPLAAGELTLGSIRAAASLHTEITEELNNG